MKNGLYFGNKGLCKTCTHGNCEIGNFLCYKCKISFSECPCNAEVENAEFCKFYEMDFPKDEIFESIKHAFKAYLIGRYGTEKEKREYEFNSEYAENNMNMSNPKREEIKAMLTHMICQIMYEMGDIENEN